jgi:uncharacterized protein (DUF1499 family)
LLFAALAMTLPHCVGRKPEHLGVIGGKLLPCPDSPNCVSSQSADESHCVAPFPYDGTLERARDRLLSVLRLMDRVKIVTAKEAYVHGECRSTLLRFIDDIEFSFDDEKKIIHVRSASRTGYYDFGVNRRRVERIRKRFLRMSEGQNR